MIIIKNKVLLMTSPKKMDTCSPKCTRYILTILEFQTINNQKSLSQFKSKFRQPHNANCAIRTHEQLLYTAWPDPNQIIMLGKRRCKTGYSMHPAAPKTSKKRKKKYGSRARVKGPDWIILLSVVETITRGGFQVVLGF